MCLYRTQAIELNLGSIRHLQRALQLLSGDQSNLDKPARRFVRNLKLPNTTAWRAYVRGDYPRLPGLPKDIPTNPDRIYTKSGWQGYGDWLGSGNPSPARPKPRKPRSTR